MNEDEANSFVEKLKDGTFEFEELYDSFLIDRQLKSDDYIPIKRRDGTSSFSPSQINMCFLRQFLDKKIDKGFPLSLLKIFDYGEIFHDRVEGVMQWGFGSQHKRESSFSLMFDEGAINIRGRVDSLMRIKSQDGDHIILYPIEVKSQGYSVKNRNAPEYDHLSQLMLYMLALSIDKGYLIYINRAGFSDKDADGQVIGVSRTFSVELDEEVLVETVERCRSLHRWYMADELPPPESKLEKPRKKECTNCQFKNECDFLFKNRQVIKEKGLKTWTQIQEAYPEVFNGNQT